MKKTIKSTQIALVVLIGMTLTSCQSGKSNGCGYWGMDNSVKKEVKPQTAKTKYVKIQKIS